MFYENTIFFVLKNINKKQFLVIKCVFYFGEHKTVLKIVPKQAFYLKKKN